ncbi:hypothetical protein [Amycolatopsis antarctica]|uniref:hypothetical protein n=1 Tax=Amycolatopsis antarctica TaxID=1854586 RepID=UPI00196BAE18|nr:hypothetical protein [Amycolatopsis antarctica]
MRQQKRRVLGSAALGLGAALAIAGCGAGQITQTDTQEPAVNGALAQGGTLLIRDASFNFPEGESKAYAAGSEVPLTLRVVNTGGADDELLEVKAEGAASATVEGQKRVIAGSVLVIGEPTPPGGHAEKPSVTATALPTSSAEPGASESGSPESGSAESGASETGASATSEPGASPSSDAGEPPATTGSPAPGVTGAPGAEDPRVGEAEVTLQGLQRELRPGQTVKVTFVFRDAGPITVDMPIGSSEVPRSDHHGAEGEHAEGGH